MRQKSNGLVRAEPSHRREGDGFVGAFEGLNEVLGVELANDVLVEGGGVGFGTIVG